MNLRSNRAVRALLATSLGSAVVIGASVVGAQSLPAGSTINAVLDSNDIDTKNAQQGQEFTMSVVPPIPSDAFYHAVIHGHVAYVTPGGQGKTAHLRLALDEISLRNGQTYPLNGDVVKMATKAENTTARKALGAGAGAAVGSQTVGRLLGGTLGSVVGLVGGAAGGYAYAKNDRPNLDLPRGASVQIQTTSSIVPRRQAQ